MNKYINFSDLELYILERALIESSYEIFNNDSLYDKEEQNLHTQLLNEVTDEIIRRDRKEK